jgi:hypothetical protein
MAPYCWPTLARSMFVEWGLIKANTRRGAFRVKKLTVAGALAQRLVMPRSRENRMKEAIKKAASEALAQMLAVASMLVIASFIFYGR